MENENISNLAREVHNVRSISLYLGISESIIRRLVKEKRMPYTKIEGCYRFYLPEVRTWLSSITISPMNQDPKDAAKRADEIWNSKR